MTRDDVLEALHAVIDPEVGVDVVELGLVVDVRVEDGVARVDLTMTSRACPLPEVLCEQARQAVLAAGPDLRDAEVRLVWDPPWTPKRMSPLAKQLLGWR